MKGKGLSAQIAVLARPWRWLIGIIVICVVGSAVAELAPPLVVRHVIDHNLLPHRSAGLAAAGLLYLGALVADSAFGFAYGYLGALVAQGVLADLRVRLFSHLLRLPISWFDTTSLGDVISRATADVDTVDELFTDGIVTLVGQMVPLIAVAVAMVALSPRLSLVAVIVGPPLLALTRYLQVRVRDAERATRVAVGRLNTQISETVGGAETLRAFAAEERVTARFRGALSETVFAQSRSTLYGAFYAPVSGLLASVVIASLLWVGTGGAFASAGVDLGTLTAFVLLFQRFFAPILALGDEWQSVQAAIAGVERVFELLAISPGESKGLPETTGPAAGIEAVNVRFGYFDELPVLHGVSLHVDPGEHVAVVGRSGAGKSTLVSLLSGLYAPWSGAITVDGLDPTRLDEHDRRRVLGVVPQTLNLFSGSIRDNITLSDPQLSPEEVLVAGTTTGLDRLCSTLPGGYETTVGFAGRGDGTILSAGQRQLVALARALVARPRALLLDEATAAIDGASDAAFRQALRETALRRGCAVLTVAHRIATARDADRVIVIEAGRIVEEGAPDELIEAGGVFAAFVQLEEAGWDWRDATM